MPESLDRQVPDQQSALQASCRHRCAEFRLEDSLAYAGDKWLQGLVGGDVIKLGTKGVGNYEKVLGIKYVFSHLKYKVLK